MKVDVAIIGAGLAGLAAARQISIHGFTVAVFEADSRLGGRVQSDYHSSGAIMDRGFQLYNPAYPEAARVLDHSALELRAFSSAVISCTRNGNLKLADPRRIPQWAAASALPQSGSIRSKLAFVRYALTQRNRSAREIALQPDVTSAQSLELAGVHGNFFEEVIQPFLAGVFLESDLRTSSRFLDLILKSFLRGTPSVPARGMQAIPDQLADALPEGSIHLNCPVSEVTDHSVTADGKTWQARAVIVAVDSAAAHELVGVKPALWNSVTTWYHLAPRSELTEGKPVLIVNGGGVGSLSGSSIINSVALTNAAPEYSPGHSLISTSALGIHPRDLPLHEALTRMYDTNTSSWELIGHYPISHALPSMPAPLEINKPTRYNNVLLAGDYRATSSIQGAMVSGRRAADSAIRQILGLPETPTPYEATLHEGRVHV